MTTKKTERSIPRIEPLGDRLLIRRDDATTTTKGGILLPESAKERPKRGTVLAVGPGKMLDNGKIVPSPLKPGDRIVISKHAGTELMNPDDDSDLLAIVAFEEVLGRLIP